MKKILIISPSFPPLNTADMHRVRQGLPYFKELGWDATIITVLPEFTEISSLDPLLKHTIPSDTKIYYVKALPAKFTRRFGMGSLSMRSYMYIKLKGDELLKKEKFDLVYFSTTAFHVMALGPGWKKKFNVPFILDIQDPWRNDFYLDKPKKERPPKFLISYNIDKFLEAKTVPKADGIISVSQGYCDVFLDRYPSLKKEQFKVIPFGVSSTDFEVMQQYVFKVEKVKFIENRINVLYVGRGGHDLRFALEIIFKAFKKGLGVEPTLFSKVHFWFIGTSYAPPGLGKQTIKPIAQTMDVGGYVTEIPDRIPYFDTLFLLKKADLLLVPGSIDTAYTASKIFPYILAQKPLLALFYETSSVVSFMNSIGTGNLVTFNHNSHSSDFYVDECLSFFEKIFKDNFSAPLLDLKLFEPYTAKNKTMEQVLFFNQVIEKAIQVT